MFPILDESGQPRKPTVTVKEITLDEAVRYLAASAAARLRTCVSENPGCHLMEHHEEDAGGDHCGIEVIKDGSRLLYVSVWTSMT